VRRIKEKVIFRVVGLLVAVCLLVSACGFEGDPMVDDIWSRNIYPGLNSTYAVGSPEYQFSDGYFTNLFVDGVPVAGGGGNSLFDATTFLYAVNDDDPQPKTPAEVMAILSGQAGGTFDWNGQNLTNLGDLSTPGSIISTGGGETGKFQTGSAGNTVFSFSGDNFDIRAGSGSSASQNVMRVKSTGDFGIGTNNPGAKLEIRNAGSQLKLSFDGTDSVIFAVDTNGVLTITPSGAAVDFASKNLTGLGTLSAFTLDGTMDANSQALINVLDLDLGTESAAGTFDATLTAANAGTAWLIRSKDSIDIHRARLGLSGGVDTAVWSWVNSTHTGLVLSGNIDMDTNKLTNLAAGSADGDSVRYEQTVKTYIELDGSVSTTAAGQGGTDGIWANWDLSGTLPVGTKSVDIIIHKLVATDSVGVRTNGSALAREFDTLLLQQLVLTVPVSADRIIEIQSDDVSDGDTFSVIGYWK